MSLLQVTPNSGLMDDYMCNCQFDEPFQYCVFHNNIASMSNRDVTSPNRDITLPNYDVTLQNYDVIKTSGECSESSTNSKLGSSHRGHPNFNHYNSLVTIRLEDSGNEDDSIEITANHEEDQKSDFPTHQPNATPVLTLTPPTAGENSETHRPISPTHNITSETYDVASETNDVARETYDVASETYDVARETYVVTNVPRCALSPSNLADIPKVKSPCFRDTLSEDSFFTESDSNSLIGNIVSNMVGI